MFRNARSPLLLIGSLFTIAFSTSAYSQDWGRLLENVVRQSIQPPQQEDDSPPQMRSQSIPSESGQQNQRGRYGGVWGPAVPPQSQLPVQTLPRSTTPRYLPPNYQQPRNAPPQNTQSYIPPRYTTDRQLSDPPTARAYSKQTIRLVCPPSVQGVCSYSLLSPSNEHAFKIRGGQSQKFEEGYGWRVRYESGAGIKTYRLRGGREYRFAKTDSGIWQLYLLPLESEDPPLASDG